jgi:hypothetical protein
MAEPAPRARDHAELGEGAMDAALLSLTLLFFLASWGFVRLCERV